MGLVVRYEEEKAQRAIKTQQYIEALKDYFPDSDYTIEKATAWEWGALRKSNKSLMEEIFLENAEDLAEKLKIKPDAQKDAIKFYLKSSNVAKHGWGELGYKHIVNDNKLCYPVQFRNIKTGIMIYHFIRKGVLVIVKILAKSSLQ